METANERAKRRKLNNLERFDYEVMSPDQFYDQFARASGHLSSERRLVLAVLTDALRCFQIERTTSQRDALYRETKHWFFFVAEGPVEMFSFEWICDALDIEPGWLRRGLIAHQRRVRDDHRKRLKRGVV